MPMSRLALFAQLSLCCLVMAAAAWLSPPAQAAPNLDDPGARLRNTLQRQLGVALQARIGDIGKDLGVSAAIVLPDGGVVPFFAGLADRANRIPMSAEHVFLSGSVGKTFVAAMTYNLDHQGVLSLDDRVSKWLGDEDWYGGIPNARSIRVADLVRHRSGLPHHLQPVRLVEFYANMFRQGPDFALGPVDILSRVGGEAPAFDAGTSYQYSDLNFLLLGLVIEAATHAEYFELLRTVFLEPLALVDSFAQTGPEIPRLASGYLSENLPFSISSPTVEKGRLVFNPAFEWTGGGLAMTSSDLARWIWLLSSGRALEWPYLEGMLDKPSVVEGSINPYAAGIRLYRDMGAFALGHGGAMPGYQSFALYFPSCEVAIAMQTNDGAVNWNEFRIELTNRTIEHLNGEFGFRCH